MLSPDRYGRQGYRHIPYTEPLLSSDRITGHFDSPAMAGEVFSFEDYVARYRSYRADPATQALSAAVPWIAVWDDHETADNSYVNGSRNHDDCNIYASTPCDPPVNETEIATWEERKANGIRAFHLYMPIRSEDASGDCIGPKIYRQFQYGDLASLIMLENRLVARTNSNPTPDNPIEDYSDGYESIMRQVMEIIGDTPIESWPGSEVETQLLEFRDRMEDYARSEDHYMIGQEQEAWLESKVQEAVNASTKWVILGQQQIMANEYLFDFEKAIEYAPTEVERAMWNQVYYNITSGEEGATTCNYATNPAYHRVDYMKCYNVTESQRDLYRFFAAAGKYKIQWIFDDWGGYKAERARVLDILSAMDGNVIVNTGDVHHEIASVLETDDSSKVVGTEFSISTTANFLEVDVIGTPMPFNDAAFVASNEDTMRYFSTNGRGVAIFTLTHDKMHMDYFYPSEPSKLMYEGVCDSAFDYYHSSVLEGFGIPSNQNDMIRVTCLPGPGKQPYAYMIENFGIHMSNPYLKDVSF
jgi:alkaline phosphatase D